MSNAYLLTGGNLGNRQKSLEQAKALIEKQCGPVLAASSLYETAAWGKTNQPAFLNQALLIETHLPPGLLLKELLQIEAACGRIRKERYGPRLIDIDILLYDDLVMQTGFLTIPHPRLAERRFALEPLAAIAPELLHPVFHKTITLLLQECADPLPVKKIS